MFRARESEKAKLSGSSGMPYGAKNLLLSLLLCHFSSLKVFLHFLHLTHSYQRLLISVLLIKCLFFKAHSCFSLSKCSCIWKALSFWVPLISMLGYGGANPASLSKAWVLTPFLTRWYSQQSIILNLNHLKSNHNEEKES
jgi:hypothetical protein